MNMIATLIFDYAGDGLGYIMALNDKLIPIARSTPIERGDVREARACAKQITDSLRERGYEVDASFLPWPQPDDAE
jgi:hypothetical protein